MLKWIALLAQADASPLNPQTVPGAVQIPTWLIITAIVGLVGGIVGLFGVLMKLSGAHQRSHDKKDEVHKKTLEALEGEHTAQIDKIKEGYQRLVDNKDTEISKLGVKLDERHTESIELMKETGNSLKVVDLVLQELRKG